MPPKTGIQAQDQGNLRFLWTENGNENIKENRPYFGAASLPSCAIYMNDFMQTYPFEEEARRSAEEIKTFADRSNQFDKIPKQLFNQIRKPTGRRQGRIENLKNTCSGVGPQDGQADVCETKASLHRTFNSKEGANNGSFSVRSRWTDFIVCHQN